MIYFFENEKEEVDTGANVFQHTKHYLALIKHISSINLSYTIEMDLVVNL